MKVRVEWPWHFWEIEVHPAPHGDGFIAWIDGPLGGTAIAATSDAAVRKAYAAALRRVAEAVDSGEIAAGLNGEM